MPRVTADAGGITVMTVANQAIRLVLHIETRKQRLDAINQLRVDRALAAMGLHSNRSTVYADIVALSPSANAGLP